MIALTTERLLIRDPRPEDLPAHHALLSDPVVMRYLDDIQTHSLAESEENLRLALSQVDADPRTYYFLRMERRDTGAPVGQIGYTVRAFADVGKVVGVGYFIHRACWGQGYTAEALAEVLRFAFEEDGVYRVECGCLKENAASERVMQKCGMLREAELKMYQLHEGQLKDRLLYRLLRPEWEQTCCEKTNRSH